MIGKILWLTIGLAFAMLISAIVMPVIWLLFRLVGLIDVAIPILGGYSTLMMGGGLIMGSLVGAALLAITTHILKEVDKLGLVFGALGGAIGGFASSLMFFPLVAIL